jgi:FlaG/FlaF family flagellin (archaellin)
MRGGSERGSEWGSDWSSEWGSSSPLGTLLMVALTVVVVGASGVLVFGSVPGLEEKPPSASVDVSVDAAGGNAQRLVLAHGGGDELVIGEFDVVVHDAGTTTRTPLSAFSNRTGTSGGRVDAGDVLRTPFLLDGPTTVQLVHRPSGNVVVEQSVSLPSASPDIVDMADSDPTQSFESGQDGAGETTVEAGGATVSLTGNQWKYVDYSYTVTEDTILVFEFNSTALGEIHGIGLENDQSQTSSRVIEVFGAQGWGKSAGDFAGTERYDLGDGWVRYEIPIGEHYESNGDLGAVQYMVFIMDCDGNVDPSRTHCPPTADGETTANAHFRNVRVYEAGSPVVLAAQRGPGLPGVNGTANTTRTALST